MRWMKSLPIPTNHFYALDIESRSNVSDCALMRWMKSLPIPTNHFYALDKSLDRTSVIVLL